MREIRDPIHGFITIDDTLEPFLNLAVMHRARRIKQTALTYLVYPGANHTRFEHLLGCMHIARRLSEQLIPMQSVRDIVRIAALLHDIGHGPLSHVSEQLFEQYTDPSIRQELTDDIHEEITATLIRYDEEISKLVGKYQDQVIELILKAKRRTVEHDIINGPFDADKLDYLLRDSYYSGVKYGVFDLERIIRSVVRLQSGPESYMGIEEDGFWAVEQLVLAKRYMTLQVYRHRIRLITDAMYVRAVQYAIDEGIKEIRELYSFVPTKEYVKRYLYWDDESVFRTILEKSSGVAKGYINRLRSRNLLKEVYSKNIKGFTDAPIRNRISKLTFSDSKNAEREIAHILDRHLNPKKIDPAFVIIYLLTIDNPTYRPPSIEIKINDILIHYKNGKVDSADNYPDSIIGSADEDKQNFIYVYAEMDGIDEGNRMKVKQAIDSEITEVFANI